MPGRTVPPWQHPGQATEREHHRERRIRCTASASTGRRPGVGDLQVRIFYEDRADSGRSDICRSGTNSVHGVDALRTRLARASDCRPPKRITVPMAGADYLELASAPGDGAQLRAVFLCVAGKSRRAATARRFRLEADSGQANPSKSSRRRARTSDDSYLYGVVVARLPRRANRTVLKARRSSSAADVRIQIGTTTAPRRGQLRGAGRRRSARPRPCR